MAIIDMNLIQKPFEQIKEGSKLIEVRINDEKRQTVQVGDTIRFNNLRTFETLDKKVVDLKYYKNFEEAFDNYDSGLLGVRNYSKKQFVELMLHFCTKEEVKQYGVVCMIFDPIDDQYREDLIKREKPFEGNLLKVRKDEVTLPNGKTAIREWVEHTGACAIVYVDKDDNILLEKQYRYPFSKVTTEIPAGKLDSANEEHIDCAIREFEEETGLISEDMTYLGETALAMAYSSEVIYLYYTNKVKQGKQNFDDDELLTTFKVPFDRALEMCNDGEIIDSKTVIAINLYNNLIRNNKDK